MLAVLARGHYTLAQPKGWRKIDPAGLRRRHYQGWPFKSGTLGDASGNPPDIRINAATNSPAHPPPQNDTNNHQAETIRLPPSCRWSRLPGSPKRPSHASILRLGPPKPFASDQALLTITKRSGQGRTFSPALSPHCLLGAARLGQLSSRPAAPVAYNKNSAFQPVCKKNFGLRLPSGGPAKGVEAGRASLGRSDHQALVR